MKAKFTFLTIALVALLGVGMLMAFKQSETNKKYMHMSASFDNIVIIDENNKVETVIKSKTKNYNEYLQQINLEMNNIALRGFRLVNTGQLQLTGGYYLTLYTFEK